MHSVVDLGDPLNKNLSLGQSDCIQNISEGEAARERPCFIHIVHEASVEENVIELRGEEVLLAITFHRD